MGGQPITVSRCGVVSAGNTRRAMFAQYAETKMMKIKSIFVIQKQIDYASYNIFRTSMKFNL